MYINKKYFRITTSQKLYTTPLAKKYNALKKTGNIQKNTGWLKKVFGVCVLDVY